MPRTLTLKKGEIIPLTFDYVFTAIFNNKDNINILENFLSCYFDIPIGNIRGNVTLLPRQLELESSFSRNKQVDLILDLNGEKINIELSNKIGQGIINRNVVYACNIHGRQLEYGDNNYTHIKKTIQINLNNVHTNKELKEVYYLMTRDGKQLTEKFEIDIIDMEIGRRNCYTKDETKLDRWCLVFTAKTKEEFGKALEGLMEEEAKEKLVEEVDKYSSSNQVVALYSKYTREELEHNTLLIEAREEGIEQGMKEGEKRGIERGIKEGKEQGIKQASIEIAKKLLHIPNNTVEQIADITGLSIETIKNL